MPGLDVFSLSEQRPFPGLRPFGPQDSSFFFGRRRQYYALYRLLNLSQFVAVIGNSGSGKSSLVRAGLLRVLEEERAETNGRNWLWAEMRPGDLPMQSLADCLIAVSGRISADADADMATIRADRIRTHLYGSSHGISKALAEIDDIGNRPFVLVIDQFEELFRFVGNNTTVGFSVGEEARKRDEAAQLVQLILEASRSPDERIRIVLTMRSDFIGDCARFQGLPEAVSATQFLVPSLTRDQREEVIREPLKRAGATIDSVLVEQLLNDSSDEFDQLPVLQHCMLRLWERAGTAEAGDGAQAPSRHLSLTTYQTIDGIQGALSQHAEGVFTEQLAGQEALVERVFRALSELDSDRRATRRALSLRQLRDETAIEPQQLVAILDRFRADDCSFLTPSPTSNPMLTDATRVDVGHEALLRRWQRVSGQPGATGERGDSREIGWLRKEFLDGQRYQALLGMAGSDDSERSLVSPDQIGRYWDWWTEFPRTTAWAERYGGHHERVEKLLGDSREEEHRIAAQRKAQERTRRNGRMVSLAAAGVVLCLIVGGFFTMQQYRLARLQREVAQRATDLASEAVTQTIKAIQDGSDYGRISSIAARDLLTKLAEPLDDNLTKIDESPDVMSMRANILIIFFDALSNVGETSKALERAKEANGLANKLVAADPTRKDWQRMVYATDFRVADAMLTMDRKLPSAEAALVHYRSAQAVAERLLKEEPERDDRYFDVAFIHNKVGEALQVEGKASETFTEFDIALDAAKHAAALKPDKVSHRSYIAATYSKIANSHVWSSPPNYVKALENYDQAIGMQTTLLASQPDDTVLQSNLATSRRQKAFTLVRRNETGDISKALTEFSGAVDILTALSARDPGRSTWMAVLAPTYSGIGSAYEKAGNLDAALEVYRKELSVRAKLVKIDETNSRWQSNLKNTTDKIEKLEAKIASAASSPPGTAATEAPPATEPANSP